MGLEDAIYEFDPVVPLIGEIELKIRELSSEPLLMEGTIDPELNDAKRAKEVPQDGVGVPMRDSHVKFWIAGDRSRWKRWVDLTVSLDGTKVALHSNYSRLFQSACNAMSLLGGRTHRRIG